MTLLYMGCQAILAIVFTRTLTALKDLALDRGCLRSRFRWHLFLVFTVRMLQLDVQQQIGLPHELVATIDALELLLCVATLHTPMIGDQIRETLL